MASSPAPEPASALPRRRPELRQPTLSEIFPETAMDAAAPAFALAHLDPGDGPVLWVQDRLSARESGRPFPPGLGRCELLHLQVSRPIDVLWAMEQGLGCAGLGAVIGEVWGSAPALDFTATKRLALRSEAHGVPAWLIRRAAPPELSAARERWRLSSLPARAEPDDARAPGAPLWSAELFRARWRAPGRWVAGHDPESGELALGHAVGMDEAEALRVTA
ncbi:protein ImuA [Limimaricola pyoseonensis]|uniref:Protein ImuA n=2 Tax=Limimaricola pyoseonensis TaxID=521013 RepID=A0A1G7DLF2_9RHOB|nr:protein ImuA [Limimaricola pyoseonensis]